jgi:hypothetical protein
MKDGDQALNGAAGFAARAIQHTFWQHGYQSTRNEYLAPRPTVT